MPTLPAAGPGPDRGHGDSLVAGQSLPGPGDQMLHLQSDGLIVTDLYRRSHLSLIEKAAKMSADEKIILQNAIADADGLLLVVRVR